MRNSFSKVVLNDFDDTFKSTCFIYLIIYKCRYFVAYLDIHCRRHLYIKVLLLPVSFTEKAIPECIV